MAIIREGLTFDDVLLIPRRSMCCLKEVDTIRYAYQGHFSEHPPDERGHGYRH